MGFLMDYGESIYIEYMTQPSMMRYSHVHPQYEMYFCPHAIAQRLVINGRESVYDDPCVIYPHTSSELSIDDIVSLCDDLIEAHRGWLPEYH